MVVRRAGAAEDVVHLETAGGVTLGRTAVLPVRVPAEDAHVTFALEGR
jgi:hypothetical protein